MKDFGKEASRKAWEDKFNRMVQSILELGFKEKDKVMELSKFLSLNIMLEIFISESKAIMVLKSSKTVICMLESMQMVNFMVKVLLFLLRNIYMGEPFSI